LLNCRHLKQSLHLISDPRRLGVRRLGHVSQQHRRRHNVLACSGEAADGLFWFPVPGDLSMYFLSPSAGTSARWAWLVLLEDLLEQEKALAIFIKLCFELP